MYKLQDKICQIQECNNIEKTNQEANSTVIGKGDYKVCPRKTDIMHMKWDEWDLEWMM